MTATRQLVDAVLALGENSRGQIAFGTLKSGIGIVDLQNGAGRIVNLRGVKDAANMVLAVAETVARHGGPHLRRRRDRVPHRQQHQRAHPAPAGRLLQPQQRPHGRPAARP
jgi:hypothetical protein